MAFSTLKQEFDPPWGYIMESLEPNKENQFEALANKLDVLQQEKNKGGGVSCVQTIIFYLRQNNSRSAKAVCWNEADKIVSYPDIRKLLQAELFIGDEEKDIPPHFRSSSDRLYDKRK